MDNDDAARKPFCSRTPILTMVLLVGLAFCELSLGYDTNALVSLRQASSLATRTWTLSLMPDGTVVEEKYNMGADVDHMDEIRTIRRVPSEQIEALVAEAAGLMKGLPEDIDERIVIDPETKAIRLRIGGEKRFAGWSSYESTPQSVTTEAFDHAWQAIEQLLRGRAVR